MAQGESLRPCRLPWTRSGLCVRCRMFAEAELCMICGDPRRDHGLVCVVETPADVVAVEESGSYRGRYFVLMGRLSPLDGIGPAELGIPLLEQQLADRATRELILATSATVEGEATAGYLAGIAQERGIRATRIAHGVPMGGETPICGCRYPVSRHCGAHPDRC